MVPREGRRSRLIRTFKYRLYPTVVQVTTLETQLFEAARLYNAALEERREAWRMQHKRIGYYEQTIQVKEIRAAGDLGIPSSRVAMDVLRRVDWAFWAFYRRTKAGQAPGYPRFRSALRYDSLTFTGKTHWLVGNRVALFGVGDVKLKLHRPMEGSVRTVTVKRSAGRWYVYFACRVEAVALPPTNEAVGVDVGLSSFATLTSGEAVANPRYLTLGAQALRVAQRRMARRVRGSHGRRKAILLVQRAYERVQNQRRDFHHKVARSLVNRFQLIAVEDLNVKGLAKGMLARSVNDAGWGQFLRLLSEKAANAARVVVAVDPAGTSQHCSNCGDHVPKTLGVRWHSCPRCGLFLGRDHNAALNILRAGMARAAPTWLDVRASVAAGADRPQSIPSPRESSEGSGGSSTPHT